MSFRNRLALFLVVTLVLVQSVTALVAYSYLRHSLIEKEKAELMQAARVFALQLAQVSRNVAADVKVLSLDYALRQAIAQRDKETEISALRNHGRRVGAARMMLVGLDGTINADTAADTLGRFPYADLVTDTASPVVRAKLASANGRIYWVVAVPVRAPLPIAYIVAFIPIDANLLDNLREISSVPRSVALASEDATGRWSLNAHTSGPVALLLPKARSPDHEATAVTTAQGRKYLVVTTGLPEIATNVPVVAVLGYPLDEALAPYWSTIWPMIGVLVASLLVALAGAIVIVRGFSRPIENLAMTARRIAAGDYTPPERLASHDELGHLSQALVAMTKSIAEREVALKDAIAAAEAARGEAEQASRAKSNFLANMSHELRTPLNAIIGFGEMIERQILGPITPSRYVGYAGDIGASARHLLSLVSRMLDLADIEGSGLRLVHEELVLQNLLRESVSLARAAAEPSSVHLEFECEEASPVLVLGDKHRLVQAFACVIGNALKFSPPEGSVHIVLRSEGASAVVAIEDKGIGMTQEDIPVVIKPFHRLKSAFDGQHQGAGLGLPFTHAIIRLHGGTLELRSAAGRGTTAVIKLPSHEHRAAAA
jgi:signal transduction histidine kinase